MLQEHSILKILKIGRQSNKYFSYSEEAKILKQLKKLQLRKIFDLWAYPSVSLADLAGKL